MEAQKVFELIEAVTGHGITIEMCDLDHDDCDVVWTAETLEDWTSARANWAEAGTGGAGTHEGTAYLFFEDARVAKGQQRKDVCVVDCGDHRLVYAM